MRLVRRVNRGGVQARPETRNRKEETMRFMMMAKVEKEGAVVPTPELMAAIGKFTEEAIKSGVVIDTGGLKPTARGAYLKLSGGKVTVIDGPFTESKEIIGGYAIVQLN